MKLLLSESQMKKIINEYIKPSQAYTDYDSIITLCNDERPVGMVSLVTKGTEKYDKLMGLITKCNLHMLKIPSNPYNTYVIYKDNHEDEAKELVGIAEKYGGYLSLQATEDETRRIGELLYYDPEDVEEFIRERYK